MKKQQVAVSCHTKNNLEEQALFQLNSGKYKEAIRLFKKLLQDSENSEWKQKLAYCYLQRAMAFAAKGMYKEALVLWENHSQYSAPPYESYDHYICWLIQTKNQVKAESCLSQLSAQQLDKHYPALAALLGLLIITDHPEFEHALPQDSAFISHLKIVQTALQAYQDNDLEAVNEALKQLPYRSSFRDFRTLLNASITAPASMTQSPLANISTDSPYSQTAKLLLACSRKGSALVQDLTQFNHKQRRTIGEIKNLNKKQLEFIERLIKYKDRLPDKIKFNLAIQYQSLCGSELAQRFCQAMLATYPAGQRAFSKNFDSVSDFEENRFKALAEERKSNSYDAEFYWLQCIKTLTREETDNNLQIALILRHIACKQDAEEKTQSLIRSLEYDPEDRDSYLQILRYFSRQQKTAKDYKQWLSQAIEKFPQDIDILTLAVQTATNNKTYQKANQCALKILTIDPLNIFAKQTLFSNHLAYARQLLRSKKFHLVEKELLQTEDLKIGKAYTLRTQLMQGFLCFVRQNKQQGLQQIADALNQLYPDPVNAVFQAAMEALLMNLPVATILRELPPVKDYLLSVQDLTQFIQLLKQYHQDDSDLERLHKALTKVKGALKKSLQQQEYDEPLLLTLCQTLDDINHFELLSHCSKLAQSKWQKPIWVYYQIYSETNGNPEQCSYPNLTRLEKIYNQARQDKDHRTTVLIDSFLDRYYAARPKTGLGFLDDLLGFDEDEDETDLEDPMMIFNHVPEDILKKLQNKISSTIFNTSPEQLVQELGEVIEDKHKLLLSMSLEPDLFFALFILKTADDLNIDINVSVEDVLQSFNVD